jgi:hypothetical protein
VPQQNVGAKQMVDQPSSVDLEQQQLQRKDLVAAIPTLPRLYANGFAIVQTASDISAILLINNSPIGILSMSHVSARSLANELDKAIKDFEIATEQSVKTINELSGLLSKMSKSNV